MLTPAHKLVAFAHVSNVLGSVLDAQRAADLAHARRREAAARRLPGGAAHAGRRRRARLRFLRLLRPQALRPDRDRRAVGAGRAARRDAAVAGRRRDDRPGDVRAAPPIAPPPQRFEAGTPAIVEAIGLARGDRLCRRASASTRSTRTRRALVAQARDALRGMNDVRAVRARGQRRHRQLRARGGASARSRHHIGRGARRDPRRAPLRPAADGPSRRAGDGAGELRALQRRERCRRAGARDRADEEDFRMNEQSQVRGRGSGRRRAAAARRASRTPRAPAEKLERKRDYLEGFLAQKPAGATPPASPAATSTKA